MNSSIINNHPLITMKFNAFLVLTFQPVCRLKKRLLGRFFCNQEEVFLVSDNLNFPFRQGCGKCGQEPFPISAEKKFEIYSTGYMKSLIMYYM